MLLGLIIVTYPYSITPGGVKADYYASHDFPAWVDMEFAGDVYWVHMTIHKGEGLTNDGRRARCGNHFRAQLPPGAKRLPPTFKFLVPVLDNPLPGINDEPPAVNLNPPLLAPPPLLTETPNSLVPPGLFGPLPIVPVLVPTCDEKKDNNCKKKKPSPTSTPEASTWVLMTIGLAAAVLVRRTARIGAHKQASSVVDG